MIKLLDCTLRDGGYVNNWEFGNNDINIIANRLISSKVDMIEVGFIDDRVPQTLHRTIQPKAKSFNNILKNVCKKQSLLFAMIDYGTCSLDNICDKAECILDGIRIIFKKPNMNKAVEYAEAIIKKGYLVCLQMVSITSYNEEEVKALSELANDIKPYAVSIVDTYGLLMEEDVLYYYNLLDKYLDNGIAIGYHSHNNFQLGYSNSIKVIEKRNGNRVLMIDGTLYGMGKSAGNAPLELLALYLNGKEKKQYNLNQILETIDCNIMKIFQKRYWGYNYKFFLSSANNCHPSYVDYLINKKTLSIESINKILSNLRGDDKLKYSEKLIESLYKQHQSIEINDNQTISILQKELNNRDILILGLGSSINEKKNLIKEFITARNPIVISLNAVIKEFNSDFIFISNAKRYENIAFQCVELEKEQIIATSNILEINKKFDYVLNYDKLTNSNNDSSLLILLEFLSTLNLRSVSIAGCDGFVNDYEKNYFNNDVELMSSDYDRINKETAQSIVKFKKILKIQFVTPSLYEEVYE